MEKYTPEYFDDSDNRRKTQRFQLTTKISLSIVFLSATLFLISLGISVNNITKPSKPAELSKEQNLRLSEILDENYPSRQKLIQSLPYKTIPADLEINAESAIIIDQETGNILFEKNADMEIPPASMTKLVEMYVVFDAVKKNEVSLDDIVPLPPQSWSKNLPSDASRMFIDEGHTVTLRELLLGLAIASGNDASIAVANFVCNDMDSFVARMNKVVKDLGLKKTHFVESSGYSEKNITTAREFAAFCRVYLNDYPEALDDYHSQKLLAYPLEKNLPPDQKFKGNGEAIIQYNTNKLLGILEGCDGLKTGYIDESGYNIALTACRGNRRFLSITMKGPGNGSIQGNKFRVIDGTTLMEFAFSKFAPYIPENGEHSYTIGCAGSKEKSIRVIPAYDERFSVPFIDGNSPEDSAQRIQVTASVPSVLYGQVDCGQEIGHLSYFLDGKLLRTIPLVADRNSQRKNFPGRLWGFIVYRTALLF